MSRSQSSASPEGRFWTWFAQNSADLLAVKTAREPVVEELHRQLHRVADGLCFEFGPVRDGRREFIVSADGNKECFPAVKRLIALAPNLPDWLPIAFRPPKPMAGHLLRYGEIEMSGDDVWFTHESAGRKIDLELHIRGLTEENREELAAPAFILLDATLGEFVVETRVGGLGWNPLPDDPEAEGLRPFGDLLSVVALPIRCPVSLRDALDDPTGPPEKSTGSKEESWTLAQMQRGEQHGLLGFRDGLLDREDGPALDHEVLVVVTFNEVLENGLPGSKEELEMAQRYEGWVNERLKARCPTEHALHITGEGVREIYLYCADPVAAIQVWEEELQPVIGSHQVAFYVRHDPEWEVYHRFRQRCEGSGPKLSELATTAQQFLTDSLAGQGEVLEQRPSLWLPVHLFAFGIAQAIGEAEELSRNQILTMAYTFFVRCLEVDTDQASAAVQWIVEHEKEPHIQALIEEGAEAFRAWQGGEGGVARLGEILAQMQQAGAEPEEESPPESQP